MQQLESCNGPVSDSLYPKFTLNVNLSNRHINLNGIDLSVAEMKAILLSFDGRAMIHLEGLEGTPPSWLTERLLTPTGYISKTPKMPK